MTDPTRTFPPPSADGRPDADLVLDLAAEYHAAKEAGGRPDLSAVCRNRPDLVPRVRELLGLGDELHALAGQPPDSLGRYAVLGLLGSGGMGDVYRATDTAFGREVALKVLQPKFGPASAAARRFADEARITGQLQHPNIPAVHDLGTLPDGRPFLAMKLVKGDTLDDLLKARPGPSAERGKFLTVFEQVCHAVAYAHARNVLHRDLKPHNVMVGAFGEVQVMDWGLAKILAPLSPGGRGVGGEGDADQTAGGTQINSLRDSDGEFTHAGSVLGTPAYISPEQAIGAVDQIDTRSDVFGLGGILCAILTGKPPFVGDTAESTRQLAAKGKLGDAFARLDASGADPDLVALCKRCLAAEKADRPADADVVAKAVAELRAAADERARQAELNRVTAELQVAEQKRRRRMQAAFAAVVLLLVTAIGVGLWRYDRQMRDNEFERQQLAQQSRFEKIQIVTDAVARLEQLRDQCQERDKYAQTERHIEGIKTSWERVAFALEQSSVLNLPESADSSIAARVQQLRANIAAGIAGIEQLRDRTKRRIDELKFVRKRANEGETEAAVVWAHHATQTDPYSPDALMLHGDLLCRQGKFDLALKSYTSARPLAAKHLPALIADIDVRIDRATYLTGPGSLLAKQWGGKSPQDPAAACDLAEFFLIAGHYDRAVVLYKHAFATDAKLCPANRLTAALAATLGGLGLGQTKLTTQRRKELRELAEAWLPTYTPPNRESEEQRLEYIPLKELIGLDAARYRFVRATLPAYAKLGDWDRVELVTGMVKNTPLRWTVIDAESMVGSPYPGKSMLSERLIDLDERLAATQFLERVVPRFVRYDEACGVWRIQDLGYRFTTISSQL